MSGGTVGVIEPHETLAVGEDSPAAASEQESGGRGAALLRHRRPQAARRSPPNYGLHNLYYTKLILAPFRACVKFHKRIPLQGSHFLDSSDHPRTWEQFPRRNVPNATFFTPLYSHEYTFHHCCGTGPPVREPPPPPRKTILRWQNYVKFRKVPIAVGKGILRCRWQKRRR